MTAKCGSGNPAGNRGRSGRTGADDMATTVIRRLRWKRVGAICLAIAWLLQSAPYQAGARVTGCGDPMAVQRHSKNWSTINLPPEFAQSSTNYSWTRPPDDPQRILLAEYGGVVYGTRDGGCTWSIELKAEGLMAKNTGQNPEGLDHLDVEDIDIGDSPEPAKRRIYVSVAGPGSGNGISSVILFSPDDGATWESRNTPFGTCWPNCIVVDPHDPDRLVSVRRDPCLAFDLSPYGYPTTCAPPWHTYISNDAGKTWTSVTDTTFDSESLADPCSRTGQGTLKDFQPDPQDKATIWALNEQCLYRSKDDGKSWALMPVPAPPAGFVFGDLDVVHPDDGVASVSVAAVASSDLTRDKPHPVLISNDGGETWASTSLNPGSPSGYETAGIVHGSKPDSLYVVLAKQNGGSQVFRFEQRTGSWRPLTVEGALPSGWNRNPLILSDAGRARSTIDVRTSGTIERFVLRS